MNDIASKGENDVKHQIREEVRKFMIEDMKLNFVAVAEHHNFGYRTVKKAYEQVQLPTTAVIPKPKRPIEGGQRCCPLPNMLPLNGI